jgi:hypothetical protein
MGTSPWTGPVILTLCVSVLALVVSAVALGWQVVSWRRSGPRVRVTSKSGFAGTEPFVSIEITNAGRLATEISQMAFQLSRLDDRKQVLMFRDVLGALVTLPMPLAAGATVSKMFAAGAVLEVLDSNEFAGTEARPYAVTGHGRTEGDQIDLRGRVRMLVDAAERHS